MKIYAKLVRVRAALLGFGALALLITSACATRTERFMTEYEPVEVPSGGDIAVAVDEWDELYDKPIFGQGEVYEYSISGTIPSTHYIVLRPGAGGAQVVYSRYFEESPMLFGQDRGEFAGFDSDLYEDETAVRDRGDEIKVRMGDERFLDVRFSETWSDDYDARLSDQEWRYRQNQQFGQYMIRDLDTDREDLPARIEPQDRR